jgi:hypothetical protein
VSLAASRQVVEERPSMLRCLGSLGWIWSKVRPASAQDADGLPDPHALDRCASGVSYIVTAAARLERPARVASNASAQHPRPVGDHEASPPVRARGR